MLAGPGAYIVSALSDRLGQPRARTQDRPAPFRHRVRLARGAHVDVVSFEPVDRRPAPPPARHTAAGLGALAAVACVVAPSR